MALLYSRIAVGVDAFLVLAARGANGLVAALLVVMMLWTSVIERGLDALAAAMALLILNKINKYNRDV